MRICHCYKSAYQVNFREVQSLQSNNKMMIVSSLLIKFDWVRYCPKLSLYRNLQFWDLLAEIQITSVGYDGTCFDNNLKRFIRNISSRYCGFHVSYATDYRVSLVDIGIKDHEFAVVKEIKRSRYSFWKQRAHNFLQKYNYNFNWFTEEFQYHNIVVFFQMKSPSDLSKLFLTLTSRPCHCLARL